jgi:alkylated DNA repair dioxygenase AlkB
MYDEHAFAPASPLLVAADVVEGPASHGGWQASLFAGGDPGITRGFEGLERLWLDELSWIDHVPRWLDGSDQLFAELVARLPWQQRTVPMYERLVKEPRLTWWWSKDAAEALPLAVLEDVRVTLTDHYGRTLDSCGCNYYRDGSDSVAWHGDRIRFVQSDSVVAIVSIGSPRPFLIRPRGGGPSRPFLLGQGDLFVMGGATQHGWEHSVPKVASAGPRLSISYRHGPLPSSLSDVTQRARTSHPSGGAHNRHVAATTPSHGGGSLQARRAEGSGVGSSPIRHETEGRGA